MSVDIGVTPSRRNCRAIKQPSLNRQKGLRSLCRNVSFGENVVWTIFGSGGLLKVRDGGAPVPWQRLIEPLIRCSDARQYAPKRLRGRSGNDVEQQASFDIERPIFTELTGRSARAIAILLNERRIATPTGGRWHAATVVRVQKRIGRQMPSSSAPMSRE